MQQLSGLDAAFLNLEAPHAPLHIGALAIYDQSSAAGELVTFKGILANIESRLHLARCFRQKLARVPLGADHPYWIEDADFDLEFHVRHIALPSPGDWRQLCIQVARIHARPLDLSQPLWEMYVIEGLEGVEGLPTGSFALLSKIHHCAIDGVSGVELTAAIHDVEPGALPARPEKRWKPEARPTDAELILRTAANGFRRPLRFARLLGELAPPAIRALWERSSPNDDEQAGPLPRTRFNEAVSSHRVFEGRTFSLDAVKQIRKRVNGATVNDVVLAVCGGAMRHYLEAHRELPRQSLRAFAPISVRTDDEKGTAGNQVSGMFVALHTTVEDPLERLERVHETTLESKQLTKAIGARNLTDLTQYMPGTLSGIAGRLVARTSLMSRLTPIANTVVTNVPGPQVPLYFTGARMVATFGLGLPLDGLGLFHAIFSYNGTITISITCCRDQLPDPGFYAECLQRSFDELLQASVDS
jgi:WS/DGAT/MGAT family acyltransferase